MAMKLGWAAMAVGLCTCPAAADSAHRLVVVIAAPNDARAAQQNADLRRDDTDLRERDVVVQNLTPDAARKTRPELGVDASTSFEVVLVGKDGGVKLRRNRPVSAKEIFGLIDTMPMRREEMKKQGG